MISFGNKLMGALWFVVLFMASYGLAANDLRLKDSIYEGPNARCRESLRGFVPYYEISGQRSNPIDSIYREFFDPRFIDLIEQLPTELPTQLFFQTKLFQKILDYLTVYFPESEARSLEEMERYLIVFKRAVHIDERGFDERFQDALKQIDGILRTTTINKLIEPKKSLQLDLFTRDKEPLSIRELQPETPYQFKFERQPERGVQTAVFSEEVVRFIKTHRFGARWLSIMMKGLVGPFGEQGIKTFDKGIYMHLLGWTHEIKHTSSGHERLLIKNENNRWYVGKLHH